MIGNRTDRLSISAQKVFIQGELWFQLPEPDPFLVFFVADGLEQSDLNPPQPLVQEFLRNEVEEMAALLRHCQLKLVRMSESLNIYQKEVRDVNDTSKDLLSTPDSDCVNSNKCQNPTAAGLTPSDNWEVKDEILIPSDCQAIALECENSNEHSEIIETSSCISLEFIADQSSKHSDKSKTDDNLSDSQVDFEAPLEGMNDVSASEEETEVEQSCDGIKTSCRKTLKMTELDLEEITIRPKLTIRKR